MKAIGFQVFRNDALGSLGLRIIGGSCVVISISRATLLITHI